jgi:branched-subunit amino acid ABC-type transport system permease component
LDIYQLLISGISQGCVYGLIALGFVLIYKATEMVNFAQGEMMMVGAFLAITFINVWACRSSSACWPPWSPWPCSASCSSGCCCGR